MECPICFEYLRHARQLNCSHCFCEECLNKICVLGEICCPICRKKHRNVIVKNLEKKIFRLRNEEKVIYRGKEFDDMNDLREFMQHKEENENGYQLINANDRNRARAVHANDNIERRNIQGVRVLNINQNEARSKIFKFFFWLLMIILLAFVSNT